MAKNRQTPEIRPDFRRPALFGAVFLRGKKTKGNNERHPRINLRPLKVNGPTWSIPIRCATNPRPQMVATNNNMRSDFKVVGFMNHSISLNPKKACSNIKPRGSSRILSCLTLISGLRSPGALSRWPSFYCSPVFTCDKMLNLN